MPDVKQPVISRSNRKLVTALSGYKTKSVRDKVIKQVRSDSRLTLRQKLDFIDVAWGVWADQDRIEKQEKALDAVYQDLISALKVA